MDWPVFRRGERQRYAPAQQEHLRKWFWWGFWSAFDLTGKLTEVRRRKLEAEGRAMVEAELEAERMAMAEKPRTTVSPEVFDDLMAWVNEDWPGPAGVLADSWDGEPAEVTIRRQRDEGWD